MLLVRKNVVSINVLHDLAVDNMFEGLGADGSQRYLPVVDRGSSLPSLKIGVLLPNDLGLCLAVERLEISE